MLFGLFLSTLELCTERETVSSFERISRILLLNILRGVTLYGPLLRLLGPLYVQAGVAGTWGPGHSVLSTIHIKDVGTAFVKIFKFALEGAKDVDCELIYSDPILQLPS